MCRGPRRRGVGSTKRRRGVGGSERGRGVGGSEPRSGVGGSERRRGVGGPERRWGRRDRRVREMCGRGRGSRVSECVGRSNLGNVYWSCRASVEYRGKRECGGRHDPGSCEVVSGSRGCVGVSSGWGAQRGSEVGRFFSKRVPWGSGRLLVGHAELQGHGGPS